MCLSIGLVAAACQADGDDAGGTPIEEPTNVNESNSEPTTPAPDPTSADDTVDPTPTDVPTTDPSTTLVLATPPPVKTSPPAQTAPPGEPATETVYEVGMVDRGLTPFVAIATDDLARRLDVEAEAIEVLTAVLVAWPDASLGCPEPDRAVRDGRHRRLGHRARRRRPGVPLPQRR